ncbi:TonB-dependent receptor domain-containing protein [Sphingomonas jaspsi]|uniref:TonB-dependent receptor domain-containing protein n=1 Tax=Sphingomonas jaspsi TaxID=392409 RepID=UPI0004BB75CD|nr:TonB-dependent receptor [Sphingomonas jaspsi]
MKLDFRQRLLATTLLVGASVIASPAFAQDAAPQPDTPTGPVEGQPTPTVAADGAPVETTKDIVVTGTRIPSANLESVAPVTVVSNQDLKLQGTARVEDLLNSLPSVVSGQNSGISNGSDGTATVDLRGLGAKRTLVLVNGRRLTPGSPVTAGPADINIIPSSIVKRVEVLTGGASSTYGADAVSGVVNFIMDTDFEGIRFDGQYSFYQHTNKNRELYNGQTMYDILNARINAGLDGYGYPKGNVADGGSFDGTVTIGTGFDDGRGHATAYFGYRKVNPVLQSRRDYSACTIQNTGAALSNPRRLNPQAGVQCGGSLTNAGGTALFYVTGTSTVYDLGTDTAFATGPRYNFAPLNYFQRPDERYTAGVFANYEISPAIKPYLEFMFMDDRSVAQIAPSGDFGNTLTINCDNPLLTSNQFDTLCTGANLINGFIGNFPVATGAPFNPDNAAAPIDFIDPTTGNTYNKGFFQLLRRNIEGGPRQADLQYTTYRGVLGTKGDLGKAWSYDAYYQYGRVNYNQTYRNEFSVARLNRALDVVTDTRAGSPTLGQAVCRSVLDGSDPNCVPYNIFTPGGVSQAAVDYLSATGLQRGRTSEQVAHVDFTGLLGEYGLKSPWAEDGVAINLGAEYRKEKLALDVDNAFATGDLTGQGAPTLPISGNFTVKEFFGEIQIPIVQKSFIYDLSFTGGYRRSDYKTSGGSSYTTDTYKLGLEFAPIQDVRFRAAYNRAARAPNIQELFATQFVGLDGGTDPCAGITVSATDYGCLAQGLVVGQSVTPNPAAQYNGLLGGNPNLTPETATTKTLGVILQPRFIPRFALTIDWFDIKLRDAIQGYGADAILNDCVSNATATFTPDSCNLINRDPAGSLWLTSGGYVIDTPTNVGGVQTRGIEFNASYSHRLGGLGNLSASMIGTWTKKYEVDNGLTPVYDCVGYFGTTCSNPIPEWKHKARLSLNTPSGIGLSLQWRFIGKSQIDFANPSASLNSSYYEALSKIKAYNYFDLATSFTFGDHYNFRLGVNNLFDKAPPLVSSGSGAFGASACPTGPCNGNTWPGTYDALGRYMYAGVTLDF